MPTSDVSNGALRIRGILRAPHPSLPISPADESCWQGVSSLPDFKETFPKWRPRTIAEVVPTLDPAGVDLLSKMLIYTPQHRITAKAAMQVGECAVWWG